VSQTPSEYIENLQKRELTTFTIKGGIGMYQPKRGVFIDRKVFENLFPLAERVRPLTEAQKKSGISPDWRQR
jgi:hypothetical protein